MRQNENDAALEIQRESANQFKAERNRLATEWLALDAQTPFLPTEFVVVDDAVYHLTARNIARDILLVGDPGRAKLIGDEFLKSNAKVDEHRGLYTVTGETKKDGQRITICTSGMGTPSEEIVINELFGIGNIDLITRKKQLELMNLSIIRVGTSGGIQPTVPLGTPIIAEYAVGLDNTGSFYDIPHQDDFSPKLEEQIYAAIKGAQSPSSRFYGKIFPYVSHSDPATTKALVSAAKELGIPYELGITASNDGFFANQGRSISPIPLSVPDIDLVLSNIDTDIGLKINNFEMESSFLFHFMMGLGMSAGSVCATIADRRNNKWAENPAESVENAINIAVRALAIIGEHR